MLTRVGFGRLDPPGAAAGRRARRRSGARRLDRRALLDGWRACTAPSTRKRSKWPRSGRRSAMAGAAAGMRSISTEAARSFCPSARPWRPTRQAGGPLRPPHRARPADAEIKEIYSTGGIDPHDIRLPPTAGTSSPPIYGSTVSERTGAHTIPANRRAGVDHRHRGVERQAGRQARDRQGRVELRHLAAAASTGSSRSRPLTATTAPMPASAPATTSPTSPTSPPSPATTTWRRDAEIRPARNRLTEMGDNDARR